MGSKGCKRRFQIEQRPTGFLAVLRTLSSALSLAFKAIPRPLLVGFSWFGWVIRGEGVENRMEEFSMGKLSLLVELRSSSPSFD